MSKLEMICEELPLRVERLLPGGWKREPHSLEGAKVKGEGNCLAHALAACEVAKLLVAEDVLLYDFWIAEKLAFELGHRARRFLNHTSLVVTSAVQENKGLLYHHKGAALGAEAIPIECNTGTITEFMGQAGTEIVTVALDFTPAGLPWDELRDFYEFDHFEAA